MILYRTYLSPVSEDNTYPNRIEITQYVVERSLTKIKRDLDSQDYDFGVFTYDDVKLRLKNSKGLFNEEDIRSLFTDGRSISSFVS